MSSSGGPPDPARLFLPGRRTIYLVDALTHRHHSVMVTLRRPGGPATNGNPKSTLGESPVWGSLPTAPPSVGRMWTADAYLPA